MWRIRLQMARSGHDRLTHPADASSSRSFLDFPAESGHGRAGDHRLRETFFLGRLRRILRNPSFSER